MKMNRALPAPRHCSAQVPGVLRLGGSLIAGGQGCSNGPQLLSISILPLGRRAA